MQGEAPSSAEPAPPSRTFTVGHRPTPGERALGVLGPSALLVLGLSSIGAGIALFQGDPWVGAAGLGAGLVVATAAVSALGGRAAAASADGALVAACPVCGHVSARRFGDAPTVCGACPAYLDARGTEVREVDERAFRGAPEFALPLRVIEALPGGARFPDACVLCGKPARHRRAVAFFDAAALEARAQMSLFPDHSTAYSASRGKARPFGAAHVGPAVRDLSFPVCGDDHAEGDLFPVAYTPETLGFSSYRAYKAFCVHNGIASLRKKRRSRLSLLPSRRSGA
jgi:hypothetical protein